MTFTFTKISDYKVLLFPDNILKKENVVGRLISDIDEDSWLDQVQIIGWMYQFYIQTPKDDLIHAKKQYKKNDIPFVTQLFTPDWIVKYMVENTLGKMYVDIHPDTRLYLNWEYFITSNQPRDGKLVSDLKSIKFIDPCMGSGHILVYAFDVFMQIYKSEGWSERDAAISILRNNIYGLDIDERAYQLAYFGLMMKARSYNRNIFKKNIMPNICSIHESNDFNDELLVYFESNSQLAKQIIETFRDAKEFGSFINLNLTNEDLVLIENQLNSIKEKAINGNLIEQIDCNEIIDKFVPLLKQARIMAEKFEITVTNPPYLNTSLMPPKVKKYINNYYANFKSDMFAVFINKCIRMTKTNGYIGLLSPYVWMFISSFEPLRNYVLSNTCIDSLIQLEYNAFEAACVPVATYTFKKTKNIYSGDYVKLSDFKGAENQPLKYLYAVKNNDCNYRFNIHQSNFKKIPGSPIGYWLSSRVYSTFDEELKIHNIGETKTGMGTSDNARFVRLWFEVSNTKVYYNCKGLLEAKQSGMKWFPYNKGGEFRRWYGNFNYLVNWENDGKEIKEFAASLYKSYTRTIKNINYYFIPCLAWSDISSSYFSMRKVPAGFIFDGVSPSLYSKTHEDYLLAFLNSKVAQLYLDLLAPTIHYNSGSVSNIPLIIKEDADRIKNLALINSNLSKEDWNSVENSWDFKVHPLIKWSKDLWDVTAIGATIHKYYGKHISVNSPLELCYLLWQGECNERFNKLKSNEEELNKLFIDIYGLQNELDPYIEDKDVTVKKADLTRDIKSFISYAVGCMFGRYSLDTEGLVYAGGEWDNSKYSSFIPDSDNIIPICDDEYFTDDIVGRFVEFIKVVYGEDTLEENLKFIASALGGKGTPREVLRNYFLNDFFKDHCNTYQVTGSGKRPIYWLFDSGKKNGFKALIYIHRYTPDLIARMRTQYIHEQQSRYRNQIEMLEKQVEGDVSTSERVKLQKQLKKFKEQDEELRVYEEKIHHWADKMEPMDLDDGVKANYAKFQELLAKIK